MAKRGVLNQRFNSIFDDNSFDEDDEGVSTLKLTDIEPNKSQPRKNFDITALNTLAVQCASAGSCSRYKL